MGESSFFLVVARGADFLAQDINVFDEKAEETAGNQVRIQ